MLIKSSTICARGYIYSFALVISSFICFKKVTDVSLIIITGVFLRSIYIIHISNIFYLIVVERKQFVLISRHI